MKGRTLGDSTIHKGLAHLRSKKIFIEQNETSLAHIGGVNPGI